jgi:diguanylate cyclase (GGDEF)-like protein
VPDGVELAERPRRQPELRPIPASFDRYAAVVVVAALAATVLAVRTGGLDGATAELTFWVLAGLVVAGELLPIKVPDRFSYDSVTVSSAFAYALLLAFGLLPALLVYALAAVVADRRDRVPAVISVFNVGQYVLAVAAAAAVLAACGVTLPVGSVEADLGPLLLAGAAFFVVNHVLAGAASAMLTGNLVGPYLRRDIGYQLWTSGCQVALSPLIVVAVEHSAWLIPLTCIPVLAIYLGGREATINEYRASHDGLTDLPNRWVLTRRLEEAVAFGRDTGDGLLLVDLDNFKLVNDTLGHHSGDVLLQQVARRMRAVTREADLLARLGGDEFAVLVSSGGAEEVAQRLLRALETPFEVEDLALDVTASIGIAMLSGADADAREVLRRADVALYEAKEAGASHARYSPERERRSVERLNLGSQLRAGIDRGELFLQYQPKVAADGLAAAGAEALVRWRHPQRGDLLPEEFVPIAEESGLIKGLTLRVLDLALEQAAAWANAGRPLRVSVNLSTRNLLDRDLPSDVGRLLQRHRVPAAALQLEVTESRMAADLKRTRSVLDDLRRMGVSIAIDDFGTGYSSLTQLQHLPVDEIKIDKSFVIGMATRRQDAAIVRSTIDLGRNLDVAVTAEGVEGEDAVALLRELGCTYLQGFHIGAPMDAGACADAAAAFGALTGTPA